ncbi:hypothetical protein NBRC116495_11280 [Aurantivibrio plasticivorans]
MPESILGVKEGTMNCLNSLSAFGPQKSESIKHPLANLCMTAYAQTSTVNNETLASTSY